MDVTSSASTGASSPVPIPSSTPGVISFETVANTTSCNNSTIQWDYQTPSPSPIYFRLAVTNIGISQGPIKSPTPVNETLTLVNQTNATSGHYYWNPVDVPEGWYVVEAVFASNSTNLSNTFFVANGTDTFCLASTVPTSTGASASSLSPTSSASSLSTLSHSKSSMTGIMAGSIVGAVGFIAILLTVVFCFWRRRVPPRKRSTHWTTTKDLSTPFSKGRHGPTESTNAIAVTSPSTHSQANHSSHSSDETVAADLSPGIEKMDTSYNDNIVAPLPLRHRPESSLPQWPKDSDFGVPLQERGTWMSGRRSEDSASYIRNLQRVDISTSSLPDIGSSPRDPRRLSQGQRASRKPVPRYDESESGGVEVDRANEHSAVDQNPVVNSMNELKLVHYLIPDLPIQVQ